MSTDRPVRTLALTVLVFLVVQPLSTGLLFAGMSGLTTAFVGNPPSGGFSDGLVAFAFGSLIQLPGAGFTGLVMALFSHRIRTATSWLGCTALSGTVLAFLIILVPLRAMLAGETLLSGLFFAGVAAILAGVAAVAAAGATLRLRYRPWLRPAAEAFD
jgi:hypothetical protein